jgi:hypothetical protein
MAYEQMIGDAPDLVFHLGDYIYEYAEGMNGKIRRVQGPETKSLERLPSALRDLSTGSASAKDTRDLSLVRDMG